MEAALSGPEAEGSETPLVDLVTELQSGVDDAFERLHRRTYLLVRKIAAPLLPPSAVDDAVQETFLMVYRKIHLLQNPQAFLGWLSRIALNVCYQWRRKQRDSVPLKPEHSVTTPSSLKVDMRTALEALGQSHRDVIILREYLGLSYEEIAEATNMPEGTVRSRLFYGRKKLQELLGSVYSAG